MTIEEKARAYDEAVKKAQCWLNDPQTIQDCNYTIEDAIQNIFPVLAKNEDEMIRKELINWINGKTTYEWSYEWCENKDRWIAYLEKQKEQKSYSLIYDKDLDKAAREYYLSGGADSPIDSTGLVPIVRMAEFGATWMKERMEKEQRPCWNPAEEDVALFNKAITTNASLSPQERAKLDILRMKFKHRPIIEQKEQKPIEMEVYEVGKGTTICGQDYKCKKDYKTGTCWYIKDALYHCSRDGYLNDQNGVSWSCTPEWFNEYIYTNDEWADKEKNDFVGGQFLQCKLSFDDFKEGEHYWLEYVGDDMYVGRSDNILNQKFHITPRQLYTLFSQKLEEVQGPPQEEKQVSLTYEPPFNENPSDKEIIEALIHHLNEQDGFLTAINCVSTKAILNWLIKQKEQKLRKFKLGDKVHWYDDDTNIITITGFRDDAYLTDSAYGPILFSDEDNWERIEQKSAEWSKEDESFLDSIEEAIHSYYDLNHAPQYDYWLEEKLKSLRPQPKPEWNEEDEKMRQSIIKDIEFERNYTSSTTGKVIGKYNEQINWLKSLPLNLKKKNEDAAKLCSNEWSDEDEEALDMCLDAIPKRWKTKSGILLTKWLKDNIRPQSKQEWSEEDRDTLLMAATVLKANFDSDEKFEDCDYDCGTLAGKLLEMRYRIGSSWKPSEEELRTLDIVITDYRHACTKGSDEKAETLKPLLEQLKKL